MREHKEIYVVESRREDSREKRNHWEGQGSQEGQAAGERDKLEQSITACMPEKAMMESISLSRNLENGERKAEKETTQQQDPVFNKWCG